MEKQNENTKKITGVTFEEALDKTGFGTYNYLLVALVGCTVIAFACVTYGSTIIIPASACELNTTSTQQGMLAAGPVVALILSGVLWGYLSDTRGRRSMLMLSLATGAVVNALASFSVNWIMLLVLQFVAAALSSGLYPLSITILSESVPMAKRNIVVLMVTSIFLLAQGIMAVIAIPVIPLSFSYYIPLLGIHWNSWRTLLLIYSLPSVFTTVWLYFMQESPKFVFTKGNEEKAMQILAVIHGMNSKKSCEKFDVNGIQQIEPHIVHGTEGSSRSQILPLFKAPLLKYTIIMSVLFVFNQVGAFMLWLPTIANQFIGIVQNGEGSNYTLCRIIGSGIKTHVNPDAVPCALNVTSLLLVLGVGVVQSTFNIIISTIVDRVGRRNIIMIITTLCGICGTIVNLVPNAIGSAVMFATMLLGFAMTGIYTAVAVSLFPTHLRALAVAFPLTCGRIGVIASVQILKYLLTNSCETGFYIFGAIFASSALVASFLPDERKKSVKDPEAVEYQMEPIK